MKKKTGIEKIYSLSPMQEGMLFHHLMDKESEAYFEQNVFAIKGEIDKNILEKSFNQLVVRHDIFRTVFNYKNADQPLQILLKHRRLKIHFKDISHLSKSQGDVYWQELKRNDRKRGFDLTKDMLLRVSLLKMEEGSFMLIFSFHHILMDGWCVGIVFKELMQIYRALRKDQPIKLDPVIPYWKYIQWLREQDKEEALRYWQGVLNGYEQQATIPGPGKSMKNAGYKQEEYSFVLEASLTDGLKKIAEENNVTINLAFRTIWGILLQKYNNTGDVVYGAVVSGRPSEIDGIENMVGLFINTIPVRIRKEEGQNFLELLENVNQGSIDSTPYEYLLLGEIQAETTLKVNLIDHILIFQNYPVQDVIKNVNKIDQKPGFTVQDIESREQTNYDFNIIVSIGTCLQVRFDFNSLVYEIGSVKQIASHMNAVITQVVKKPDLDVNHIEIIPAEERSRILFNFNNTRVPYPKDKTIHVLFVEQVERTPDRIAVVGVRQLYREGTGGLAPLSALMSMTYKELSQKSDQLADHLGIKGVKPDTIVSLLAERSPEIVIGILGILKAGGAYLPIDPDYPGERINFMLKDSNAGILVTTPKLQVKVKAEVEENFRQPRQLPLLFINIETELAPAYGPSHSTLTSICQVTPTNLAYIIYTSGTTGKPKGVLIQHRNVVRLMFNDKFLFDFSETDVWTLFHSACFDFSVWEMYGALLYGGKLLVIPKMTARDSAQYLDILRKNQVTILNQTPSAFYHLSNLEVNSSTRELNTRYVIFGGEALDPSRLKEWKSKYPATRLINMYGITETTVHVTFKEIGPREIESGASNIGKPIPTLTTYVMDKHLHLQPLGITGELCVGGDGVGRGYLNRPALTADKFYRPPAPQHHNTPSPQHTIYRSGDLARWLPDGDIEFSGRIDNQVKIRGFRIELGEIENRLLKYHNIKEAVVIDREDENGEKYLCAYIVIAAELPGSADSNDSTELREFLSHTLPDYMIPSYFVNLDQMPFTSSGKIDRKALPEPGIKSTTGYVPPENRTQEKLLETWSEVLGIEKDAISIDANFFELGGHSLKAVIMATKVHRELNIKLSLAMVFKTPSIRELAESVKALEEEKYISIENTEKREFYPLSSAQKRLYALQQLDLESTSYNMPNIISLDQTIEIEKLEETFRELIARHESIRTSFEMIAGEPVQRVHREVEFAVEYYGFETPVPESQITNIVKNFVRPFDLSRAPFLRMGLIHTPPPGHPSPAAPTIYKRENSASKYILMVDMHHSISDGTSHEVLIRDFTALYAGKGLPGLRLHYRDYSQWQHNQMNQQTFKQQEKYWLKEYTGEIPLLDLPTDYPRPPVQRFEGTNIAFELSRDSVNVLNELAQLERVTLFMVLLAIYTVWLSKLSGQEDIVVGTPTAGRKHADLEKIIGMFVNTLPLRNYPPGEKTFTAFLRQVKLRTLDAFENQDYQLEELVEKVVIGRETSRNPLFDVMFVLQNLYTPSGHISPEARKDTATNTNNYTYDNKTSKFDLSLSALEEGERLYFSLEYCTQLFREETILKFIQYFKKIISSVTENPGKKISEIEIISEKEKKQILYDFNNTGTGYPKDKILHQLFEEQVIRTPDHISVLGVEQGVGTRFIAAGSRKQNVHLTYKELNRKSNQMARLLIEKGIIPGTIVGIMVERSVEMIVGLLGILKTGAAYLPIDPDYPEERLDFMLKDSGTKVLVTTSTLFENRKDIGIVFPGALNLSNFLASPLPLFPAPRPTNLAYVIYTSGTTGRPKGVLVEHKSVVNVVTWFGRQYDLGVSTRVLLMSDYTFDASVNQVFGTLLYGAALYVMDKRLLMDIKALRNFIRDNIINMINFVPILLKELLDCEGKIKGLEIVICGGDRLEDKIKDMILGKGYRLYNHYGPTEAAVDALAARCSGNPVNLGRPISNAACYILDKYGNILPAGVNGELVVSGAGVARGYLNNPELTAEKFRRDVIRHSSFVISSSLKTNDRPNKLSPNERFPHYPITPLLQSPIYLTGDMARWLPDGNIEFLGRLDQQVKIRGFRIELAEIEKSLLNHEKIKEVVVISKEDEHSNKYLCAYIVSNHDFPGTELRDYLSPKLPHYMLPDYFVKIDKVPLTPSGKVDRKTLPVPGSINSTGPVKPAAPRNHIEKKLVEIWEKVLGRNNIGINDNFFMTGGDSIKAIQIMSRMNSEGYKIEAGNLFQYPRISELSLKVKKLEHISDKSEVTGRIPLTPIQKKFFTDSRKSPHHFNQAVMLNSKEKLEKKTIKTIFKKLQEHHDALRMTFKRNPQTGEIVQFNHGLDYPLSLQTYDFKNRENYAEVLKSEANKLQASIDLENGPLMKLGLFHLDDGDRLLIVIHHLVVDGVSWRILFQDIDRLFQQYKRAEQLVLPLKTDSFKVWSKKLSGYANSTSFLKEKAYWVELQSISVPAIPKGFAQEDKYYKDKDIVSCQLREEESLLLLSNVNDAFGTGINDILLTALALGIRETFGHNRSLIALEGHGREELFEDVNISRTIGWFTTVYPVLLEISPVGDLGRHIKEIKETLRKIPNNGIGHGILKYLTPGKHKKRIAFKLKPQISFNYLGQFDADVQQMISFKIAKESTGNAYSMKEKQEYQLDVSGMIANNQLITTISFNKRQFKRDILQMLLNNFKSELCKIIAFCSSRKYREFTPSDFTYKRLSIETVDRLNLEYLPEDIYTLSPMQEGMLFHALYDDSSPAYFQLTSYRLHGNLDITIVEKSLNKLLKRYDILRTVFIHKGLERPVQIVIKDRKIDLYYEDISDIGGTEDKEAFIYQFKEKDKQRYFDISNDVLMRLSILQAGKSEYEMIWSFHHILMDGWCVGILNSEFLEIYTGFLENRPRQLPVVKPYRTYIQWLEKQDNEASKIYWKDYLDSYEEVVGVPGVKVFESGKVGYKNERVEFLLDREKTARLNQAAGRNHVTLNIVTQVIWGIILGKYNGKEDVVFGAVVSGRPSQLAGVESMVGLFINTIPVRIKFEAKMKFSDLLKRVQAEAISGEPYHYYSLAEIQSGSVLKNNLINNIFVFENYPLAEQIEGYESKSKKNDRGVTLGLSNIDTFEQTNYDFNVIIGPGNLLLIRFDFNSHLYDRDLVERIARHFCQVINRVIDNQESHIKELSLLSSKEKNQILYDFNDTKAGYPKNKTLHELFEEQVEKTTDRIAVIGMEQEEWSTKGGVGTNGRFIASVSYGELNNRANHSAHLLREKGVQADTIVGIMVERSIEMIIGLLGILKASGAYLPIDPGYPGKRISSMLADSSLRVLVSKENEAGKFCESSHLINGIELILMDNEKENPSPPLALKTSNAQHNKAAHTAQLTLPTHPLTHSPGQLCCIIHTSGTTGRPRGVLVNHKSAVNVVTWFGKQYDLGEGARVLLMSDYTFDASLDQVFGTLLHGAALYVIDKKLLFDIEALRSFIEDNRINVVNFVPMFLKELLDCERKLKSLEIVISGADRLEDNIKDMILGKGYRLYNHYGPTETVTDALTARCSSDRVNLGRPISNAACYILDKYGNILPVGVRGELVVSGAGVARGYLNNPELTAEKFCLIPLPHSLHSLYSPIYRTGDLARWLLNGHIEFLGRMDRQVKIRGFRIELGEIEYRLLSHEKIREAVVINRESEKGETYLCAYFVAAGTFDKISENVNLKDYLLRTLPDYMIPAYFLQLEHIPLTPNGKINRKALPLITNPDSKEYIAPGNLIEKKLTEIWSEILNVQKVGINDDFFELGGHSLNSIKIVARIYKEFGIELPITEVYRYPTPGEISKYITSQKYVGKQVVLLNKNTQKKLFCFPPIIGYGIIYSNLASILTDYALYVFNFIEEENRIIQYVDLIKKIQPGGPYVFFGWSAAGPLIFEAAKEIENQEGQVSDIILVDCFWNDKNDKKNEEKAVNPFYREVEEQLESLGMGYFKEKVINKVKQYGTYLRGMSRLDVVNANVYLILADEKREIDKSGCWEKFTTKSYKTYQGFGKHGKMFDAGTVEKNAEIIKKILGEIEFETDKNIK